jgi:hypothetical protein
MDSATGRTSLGHLGVDIHDIILCNTHSIFLSSVSHALYLAKLVVSHTLAKYSKLQGIGVVHHGWVSRHILSPSSYTS